MAVYTDVAEGELGAFLKHYPVGDLLSYKGIAEGTENSNFLLHTSSGSYILTLYEKRVEKADLPFFLGLMGHLANKGVSCPLPVTADENYAIPVFDIDAWLIEIGLMLEWYLPDRGVQPSEEIRSEFLGMWRGLLEKPAAAPQTWVIRDFHSPNIIWLAERTGILRVGIIDFQDALLGPAAYDVVSLLQDARIDVPEQLELSLLTRYIKARRATDESFDPAGFAELYAIMSAQRNTRLLGTFARLNRRDGKPQYLKHQPRIWTYLERSLAHPALATFRIWYTANVPPPVP